MNKLFQMTARRRERQRGQTMMIFVLSLTLLLGFLGLVMDGGHAYHSKRNMQNSADAGALAGTLVLMQKRFESNYPASYQTAAINEAIRAAKANGAPDDVEVTPVKYPDVPTTWSDPLVRGIRAAVHNRYDTLFIRVVGITQYDVRANATAAWGYTRSIRGMVPMAVNVDSVPTNWAPPPAAFQANLSPSGGGAGNVNYGTFTVNGQTLYSAWRTGMIGEIILGKSYPANDIKTITADTCQAIKERINAMGHTTESYLSFSSDSPRVVVMSVINGDVGGATIVPINVVTVFLDAVDCSQQVVKLHFVRAPIQHSGTIDPTIINPPVYTPALMKLTN